MATTSTSIVAFNVQICRACYACTYYCWTLVLTLTWLHTLRQIPRQIKLNVTANKTDFHNQDTHCQTNHWKLDIHVCQNVILSTLWSTLWPQTEPRTNKSAFILLRQLTTWHCSHLLLQAWRPPLWIDICPPGPQQQTRRSAMQRSMDGTERWTDRRTPYRYAGPAAYCASSINHKISK